MILDPGKTEFSEADHAEIRAKVKSSGLTQADVAREADIAESTLSGYLSGKYKGNTDPVALSLHRWLEARAATEELRRQLPKKPLFQPLATSNLIRQRFDYARVMGRLVVISGVPGVSKTATAQQYCSEAPRRYLATLDPSSAGVPTMLIELLWAMGIEANGGLPQVLARRVVAKATEADTGCTIIIDEGQHASDKTIEQLRAINDRTRQMGVPVGIVLLGNEGLAAKIGPTARNTAFAQVSSRVAQRKSIISPAREDVVGLAQAWADANGEVITAKDIDFLIGIAMKPGGLRNVEMTFEGALIAAHGASQPLDLTHLKGAFGAITDLGRAAA